MSSAIKGLLIKEFKLMKSQLRLFLIIMLIWGILMATGIGGSFLVGYTAMLFSFLTFSTFSYDEFENGVAYLFTLPVLRKDYISEKYLFGVLTSTLPAILVSMVLWIVQSVQGNAERPSTYLLSVVISLPMAYLLLALEIPLMVRFGQEKSRLISGFLLGCMAAGYGIIQSLYGLAGIDSTEAVNSITGLGTGVFAVLAVAVAAVLLLISYRISCRFMEKKEF